MMKIIDNTLTGRAPYRRISSEGVRNHPSLSSRPSLVNGSDGQNDKVMLSEISRKMRQAMDALHALPDVRQQRIESLRSSLEAGTYRLDPEKIAEKMIAEMQANGSAQSG